MATYVTCKNRQDRKVELAVCLINCKEQIECDNFNEVPREIILAAAKKLGLVPEGSEKSGPVIDVGAESPEEPHKKEEPLRDLSGEPLCDSRGNDLSKDTNVKYPITEQTSITPRNGKAQQLYQQALSLKVEIEVRWFKLGKILEEIFEGRHFIDLGYLTWREFCEVALGPLELKWRAIDYLRMTWKKCDEVGIGSEIAGEIGWSRFKELIPVITKENKSHWIDVARRKETTVQVLNAKVRVARGKITEEESKVLPEKMFFSLFKEQKDNVERTLELAYRMTDSDSRGNQLEMVCAEFRATYESEDGEFSKKKIVSDLLNRIEAVIKVKIGGEVIDVETGEILVEAKG